MASKQVINAFHAGIIAGWLLTWPVFQETIAKRTGRLRRGIKSMMLQQVSSLQGKTQIQLQFKLPTSPDYAPYHIIGPHGKATKPSYKDPNIPGTRPLSERVFMDTLKRFIQQSMQSEFTRRKFDPQVVTITKTNGRIDVFLQEKVIKPKTPKKELPKEKVETIKEDILKEISKIKKSRFSGVANIPDLYNGLKNRGYSDEFIRQEIHRLWRNETLDLQLASDPRLLNEEDKRLLKKLGLIIEDDRGKKYYMYLS